jgi:hypothetical protein
MVVDLPAPLGPRKPVTGTVPGEDLAGAGGGLVEHPLQGLPQRDVAAREEPFVHIEHGRTT